MIRILYYLLVLPLKALWIVSHLKVKYCVVFCSFFYVRKDKRNCLFEAF